MTSRNEQDLVFRARFEDDASEDMERLQDDIDELDSGMGSLNLSAVTAGLALFGVGIGASQLVSGVSEANDRMARVNASLKLLPDNAQTGIIAMRESFGELGGRIAETDTAIEQAAINIANASGGIVPSMAEIEGAFNLAAATGTDVETAAYAIGQALAGNEEPLNALVDQSGRDYHSLASVLDDVAGAAEDAVDPMDRFTNAMNQAFEVLNNDENLEKSKTILDRIMGGTFIGQAENAIGLWNKYWEAVRGGTGENAGFDSLEDALNDPDVQDILGLTGKDLSPVDPFDTSNSSSLPPGIQNIIINGGVFSDEETIRRFVDKLEAQLRLRDRTGVGVGSSPYTGGN
jgi:hypothetical protein